MQLNLFGESVASARQKFIETLDRGDDCDCPVCGRFAKVWRRKIHASIAAWLVALYRAGAGTRFVHIDEVMPYLPPALRAKARSSSDYCIIKYWGLAFQDAANQGDDKKVSGKWRLTQDGWRFARGEMSIPKYAYVFDDKVLKFDGDDVFIKDCIGNSFSYNELWD